MCTLFDALPPGKIGKFTPLLLLLSKAQMLKIFCLKTRPSLKRCRFGSFTSLTKRLPRPIPRSQKSGGARKGGCCRPAGGWPQRRWPQRRRCRWRRRQSRQAPSPGSHPSGGGGSLIPGASCPKGNNESEAQISAGHLCAQTSSARAALRAKPGL